MPVDFIDVPSAIAPPGGPDYSLYPTSADLSAFLSDANLTVATDQLQAAVLAGIADLEEMCSRHFLAGYQIDNTPQGPYARNFDPPSDVMPRAWGTVLDLGPGGEVARLDSVTYTVSGGGAPQTFVPGTDYRPMPLNAAARGRPATALQFNRWWWEPTFQSSWGAIAVTGLWGYALKIDPDVWTAMLANASLLLFSSRFRGAGVPLGIKSWTGPGGVSQTYDAAMLTARIGQWQDIVRKTVMQNGDLRFG